MILMVRLLIMCCELSAADHDDDEVDEDDEEDEDEEEEDEDDEGEEAYDEDGSEPYTGPQMVLAVSPCLSSLTVLTCSDPSARACMLHLVRSLPDVLPQSIHGSKLFACFILQHDDGCSEPRLTA